MRDVRIVAVYDVIQDRTRKIVLAINKLIELEDKVL